MRMETKRRCRPVARQLNQPPAVASQYGLQTLMTVFSQPRERAAFVATHEAGVAHHIGRNDGC